MGAKKRRREAFRLEHPLCCYCGRTAETDDHNPPRCFFPEGGVPKGFVVPSCAECNHKKKNDESAASLVFSVFNLNEPFGAKHQKATTERLRSFMDRDPELREMIFAQVPADSQDAETMPFEIPDKYKLAVVRCGVSLFRAIYYQMTRSICRRDQNLLIRFTTNRTIEDERDPVEKFVALLNRAEPPTADQRVPSRFAWGFRAEPGRVALAAEISGSTLWMGFIQRAEPLEPLTSRFDWFRGDGELVCECG